MSVSPQGKEPTVSGPVYIPTTEKLKETACMWLAGGKFFQKKEIPDHRPDSRFDLHVVRHERGYIETTHGNTHEAVIGGISLHLYRVFDGKQHLPEFLEEFSPEIHKYLRKRLCGLTEGDRKELLRQLRMNVKTGPCGEVFPDDSIAESDKEWKKFVFYMVSESMEDFEFTTYGSVPVIEIFKMAKKADSLLDRISAVLREFNDKEVEFGFGVPVPDIYVVYTGNR